MRRSWKAVAALTGLLAMVAQAGCSSDGEGRPVGSTDQGSTTTGPARPDGPAARLAGPLTGGNGINLVSSTPVDLAGAGWVEDEYTAEGAATSYRAVGDLPADGTYELEPDATADYRTRLVVRRPGAAEDFNGTVVVEWLNVSAGLDAQPDFSYLADELLRGGYAWVGVSAQRIGVEGGPALVGVDGAPLGGLKGADPARYGALQHPGDAFAYDIVTQVARSLREPGAVDALGGLRAERLLAVGESQSAYALTTYVDGVQPLTGAFDGFLVHSRGAGAAPLGEAGKGLDLASGIIGPPTRIRADSAVPVLVLESETDVLGVLRYLPARQPDSGVFRLWEVAGTAHADAFLVGPIGDLLGCGAPINAGPMHFVAKAALRHLDAWVRTGRPPPEAARLDVDDSVDPPVFRRDEDGNARGGIRTPQLDVPVATLTGEASPDASLICALMGSTRSLSPERLSARYPSAAAYMAAYEAAADEAIATGFVLEDDRVALLADADPAAISSALPG